MSFIYFLEQPNGISISDEKPVVAKGSSSEIECSASGFPIPEVSWYKDNVRVKNQVSESGRSTLVLKDMDHNHAGLYACRAVNTIDGKMYKIEGYSIITGI